MLWLADMNVGVRNKSQNTFKKTYQIIVVLRTIYCVSTKTSEF